MTQEPANSWQDISSVPDLERVIVAGWQKPSKRTSGYWWMHEDCCFDGVPEAHPDALLWHPFPERPKLPAPSLHTGENV